MAKVRTSLLSDSSTTANFQLWGSAVSAAIGTCGWVNNNDTGTINWSTVTAPASSAFGGFEIWHANDALQATVPFFFKIEYGRSSTGGWGCTRLSLGTGSNGSGTLTNATSTFSTFTDNASSQVGPWDCLFSGDSGRLQVCLWRNSIGANGTSSAIEFFSIERSTDASGNPSGDYQYLQFATRKAGTASFGAQGITGTGGLLSSRTTQEGSNNNDASSMYSAKYGFFPTRPVLGYERPPLLGFIRGASSDWLAGDTPSLTLVPGWAAHTYFCLGNVNSNTTGFGPTVGGNNVCLMRWE